MSSKTQKINKALRYVDILGGIAEVLIHISSKPKPKDYLALGLASAKIGANIYQEFRSDGDDEKMYGWFRDNEKDQTRMITSASLRVFVLKYLDRLEVIEENDNLKICKLIFGEGAFYFIASDISGSEDQPHKESMRALDIAREAIWYGATDEQAKAIEYIRERIWAECKNSYIYITPNCIDFKEMLDFKAMNYVETGLIKDIKNKINLSFANDIPHRSFLIEGRPGTGKTTGIEYVLSGFEHKIIRINLEVLSKKTANLSFSNTSAASRPDFHAITKLIALVEPDFIVLDDIDYLGSFDQSFLLSFFEEINKKAKIVLATVNDVSKLSEAIKRPGRFDEHIFVKELEESVLKQITPEEEWDKLDKFKILPIVYINEFLKRKKLYGYKFAESYLDEQYEFFKTGRNEEDYGSVINPINSPNQEYQEYHDDPDDVEVSEDQLDDPSFIGSNFQDLLIGGLLDQDEDD